MIKKDITEYAIYFSQLIVKEKRRIKSGLLKRKVALEKRLACINLQRDKAISTIEKINRLIDQVNDLLQDVLDKEIQGTILRSKSSWYEQGEKNSKYFFNLECSNVIKRVMTLVQLNSNEIITNPKTILKEQRNFYQTLYSSNPRINFDMSIPPPIKVSEADKKGMEGLLTMQELSKALSETKCNKSPGPDGLPADLYKIFYLRLKFFMLDALNECFEVKRIFRSGREGIISLIPKKGRDRRFLKNWRLIILLCVDYKLISKIISNRIRIVLDKIIHQDQSGFIPGRNISDNIRQVIDGINLI